MPLARFLRLGVHIAGILDRIHGVNIIHKDINPTNIIWNPDTDQVEIIALLSAQAAISIENASLYNTLEQKVGERTAALRAEVGERKRAEAALKRLNRELQQLASLDGLTGLANRRYFDEYLATEWKRM